MESTVPKVIIALTGAAKVGKTEIFKRLTQQNYSYSHEYCPTIGVEPGKKVEDDTDVEFEFWDLSGQQCFAGITNTYLTNVNLVFLCFDPNVSDSFSVLGGKIDITRSHRPDARFVLVKTKSDITDSPDAVTQQQIDYFIEKHQIEHEAVNVSAMDGTGMDKLREHARQVAESLMEKENTTGRKAGHDAQQSSAGNSTGNSSFCLNALLAIAVAGGLALCVAALVTALVVSSLPLSAALLAAGAISGLAATATFFYRRSAAQHVTETISDVNVRPCCSGEG
ncbi:MAG: GTP-binding protein [Legionellaceae bacterium]|nr:GTP-binding protein [Legionellaceae bacterium]